MKHLKLFSTFINEQEKPTPAKAQTGSLADFVKQAGQIFKDAGFLQDVKDPIRGSYGPNSGASDRKVPSEAEKQANIKLINDALEKNGFKDQNLRAAIIGITGNECEFSPFTEQSYYKTGFPRMKEMFSSRVEGHESEIESWKKLSQQEFDNNFWELVYGYQTKVGSSIGNTAPGDGAKYRGAGFNQITGKGEYQKMQELYNKYKSSNPDSVKDLPSIDIVSNPEQLNDPKIAAEMCALYFLAGMESSTFKTKYPDITLEGPNNRDNAVVAVANINAGLGHDMNSGPFVSYVSNGKGYANDLVQKNLV